MEAAVQGVGRPQMCARPSFTPRPSHLHEASSPQHTPCVRAVYNEVILDDKTFVRSLPLSIDAVFFLPSACDDTFDGPKCEAYARGAHRNILRHFELTEAQLPLVLFDYFNFDEPFTAVPNCDPAATGVFSCGPTANAAMRRDSAVGTRVR